MAVRAPNWVFEQADLDLLELSVEGLSADKIKKAFYRLSLRTHPDKAGKDSTGAFQKVQAAKDRLMLAWERFTMLRQQQILPASASASNAQPASATASASASNAQPGGVSQPASASDSSGRPGGVSQPAEAPPWNPDVLVDHPYRLWSDALAGIMAKLDDPQDQLIYVLKRLQPGQRLEAMLRGASQPAQPVYHGTSFQGMRGILIEGFKGSFGAGRAAMFEKFGEDLPCFYGSYRFETARHYPLAMVSDDARPCGEVVCKESPTVFLRIVLKCVCDVSKRRFKLRRGKGNHQEVYLPEDVEVVSVIFLAEKTTVSARGPENDDEDAGASQSGNVWAEPSPPDVADSSQIGKDTDHDSPSEPEPAGDADFSQSDYYTDPDVYASQLRQQIMIHQGELAMARLRIGPDDVRSRRTLAQAVCELLSMRDSYLEEFSKPASFLIGGQDMAILWRTQLKPRFEEQADPIRAQEEEASLPAKRRRKLSHSRMAIWLRRTYGRSSVVRDILAVRPPPGVHQHIQEVANLDA